MTFKELDSRIKADLNKKIDFYDSLIMQAEKDKRFEDALRYAQTKTGLTMALLQVTETLLEINKEVNENA